MPVPVGPPPRVLDLWERGGIDAAFAGLAKVAVPWATVPRSKRSVPADQEALERLLSARPVLSGIDPRQLLASQTWVVRHHVEYYLSGAWERTGTTAADRDRAGNRYPVVMPVGGQEALRIMSGHHRSLAALLRGQHLLARVVGTLPGPGHPLVVAPAVRLRVSNQDVQDPSGATLIDSVGEVEQWLRILGLGPEQIQDRLHMAATGRTLGNF